jgi:hypothetical protein
MSEAAPRSARPLAAALALTLSAASALLLVGAGPAGAVAGPRAQSVGRFLDGQLGPQTLESVIDLTDARASNPGTVTDQNPLDIKAGGQGDVPLSHKAQLPGNGNTVHFGVANQVAKAQSNGYAYGASGAVANSGGVSAGGQNGHPANATINLSPKAVPSPGTLPLPGAGNLAALGGLSATIGAVSGLASTPAGFKKPGTTDYNIAGLGLSLGSPALGGFLGKLADALKLPAVPSLPAGVPTLPKSCSVKSQTLSTIELDGGTVTINPKDGSIGVDLAALLRQLGVDLNALPANTDVLAYLLNYLSSAKGLATGVQDVLHGVFDPLQARFTRCIDAFKNKFPGQLSSAVQKVLDALTSGQQQIEDALNTGVDQLTSAGGANALAPLADGLKQLLDIGVNVQPNGKSGTFASALKATPDQATPVIARQTIVRAIEINFVPAAGSSPAATLALGNAAAGPSTPGAPPAAPPVTHHHPAGPPATRIPTGIPAGQGTHGGSPELPLVLLALGAAMAGAGAIAWRVRTGRHSA